jgi:hypothetical protein
MRPRREDDLAIDGGCHGFAPSPLIISTPGNPESSATPVFFLDRCPTIRALTPAGRKIPSRLFRKFIPLAREEIAAGREAAAA